MTINELLAELKKAPNTCRVIYDFCNCIPTTLNSYRGNYKLPGLGWKGTGRGSGEDELSSVYVWQLIQQLELAISGKVTFNGWKGGEYCYTGEEQLYIDNWGDTSGTLLSNISYDEYTVILHTQLAE